MSFNQQIYNPNTHISYMQEIYTEFIRKILQNKPRLEKQLSIKITNKGKNLFISGKPEHEFIALEVIQAINLGFSVTRALLLKDENANLQTLNIKSISNKHNLEEVRARIIGKQGRTLKTLNKLTNCVISLQDNQVGIIGDVDDMEDAVQAITSVIQGSKQGHVYGRLERQKKEKRLMNKGIEDEII